MTAVGTTVEYSNANTPQAELRVASFETNGGGSFTYTPTNSTGKTIRIVACDDTVGGPVICTVSSGVITVDGASTGSGNYTLLYWLRP